MMPPIANDDYKAQWDAETLAEAKSIEKDPNRLQKAQDAAGKLASEQSDKAQSMRAVAARNRNRKPPGGLRKGPALTNNPAPEKKGPGFNVFQRI